MKQVNLVTLDSKELRAIVAKALNIPLEKVVPQRYGIAVNGYSAEQVAELLRNANIQP